MDPHSVISLTFTVYSLSGRDLWTHTVLFPSHLLSTPCQEGTYGPSQCYFPDIYSLFLVRKGPMDLPPHRTGRRPTGQSTKYQLI